MTSVQAGQRFLQRFWTKINISGPDECWLWMSALDRRGYGKFGVRGPGQKNYYLIAHRLAWELANASQIADGLGAFHRCDNPPCCNPAHIFIGTQMQNMHDMIAKGRNTRGEQSHYAKLNAAQVLDIRATKDHSAANRRRIARTFGVSPAQVLFILQRKKWRHL